MHHTFDDVDLFVEKLEQQILAYQYQKITNDKISNTKQKSKKKILDENIIKKEEFSSLKIEQ